MRGLGKPISKRRLMLIAVKADEERAAQTLRAQAMAQRSQLLQAKEAHEQQRSSQKTKVAGVEPQSISKEAKKTR